jgi:hypothetical protein
VEQSDYITSWVAYLIAAVVFSGLAWRVLRKLPWRPLAFLLECWLLAILFTPWYVLADQKILAPALMVFAMDSVTISPEEGLRALIPLIMVMFGAAIVAALLSVVDRIRMRKKVVLVEQAAPVDEQIQA